MHGVVHVGAEFGDISPAIFVYVKERVGFLQDGTFVMLLYNSQLA
jgi:hypothetical protein